jgi:hypothetical protein
MNYMQMIRYESWIAFTQQAGSVERVFDLFLIFLNPKSDVSEDINWVFRTNMASLLSSLLVDHFETTVLVEYLGKTLFLRLLSMLPAAPEEIATIFLRCAIQIGDIALRFILQDRSAAPLNDLLQAVNCYSLMRGLIVEWVRRQVNKFITPLQFCSTLVCQPPDSSRELTIVSEVAMAHGGSALTSVFQRFCRGMVQRKVWMRTYADLLSNMMTQALENPILRIWFEQFMSRTVMFICLGLWKNRYLRRIHMLVAVLASPLFKADPEVWSVIISSVNAAYSAGMGVLANFFDLEDAPISESWVPEFKRLKRGRGIMKAFPFRANSCELFPIPGVQAPPDDLLLNASGLPREVAELPISSHIKGLLVYDPTLGATDQRTIVYDLEDTIDCQGENLLTSKQKAKNTEEETPLPNPRSLPLELRRRYRPVAGAVKSFDEDCSAQSETLNSVFLERTAELLEIVRTTPHVGVNMELLKMFAREPTFSIRSRKVIRQRGRLREYALALAALSSIHSILAPVKEILADEVLRANPMTLYTKPSALEGTMTDMMYNPHTFEIPLDAIANFLAAKTADRLKAAMIPITASFLSVVKLFVEQNKSVLHNALIRVHFNMTYDDRTALKAFPKADLELLTRASRYARNPVSSLNLPTTMIAEEVHRVPIGKYFGTSKLVQIASMSFMVSPVDMLQHIIQCVTSLNGFFSRVKMTPAQLKTVFLALVSRAPPVNAVSICRFLEHWDGLQMSPELDKAKLHYVQAIEALLPSSDAPRR